MGPEDNPMDDEQPTKEEWEKYIIETLRAENDVLKSQLMTAVDEIDKLKGIKPQNLSEKIHPMQRFGVRWNGPSQPLAVPMDDGYWTPYHAAKIYVDIIIAKNDRLNLELREKGGTMPNKYEIRTIKDMISVPADKRGAMLSDLLIWLTMTDDRAEIESKLSKILGSPTSVDDSVFTWIDDGIEGLSGLNLTYSNSNGTVCIELEDGEITQSQLDESSDVEAQDELSDRKDGDDR